METQIYFEEIKDKSKTARLPVLSKKKMFGFENTSKQDKAVYMQETNQKNINIHTMYIKDFKGLSEDTQKTILKELINKYYSNTEISRHTNISPASWSRIRRHLGFPAATKSGGYNHYLTKEKLQKTTQQSNVKQEVPKKEITNVVEIKICLENCGGVEAQKKLESLTLFLEDNKKYDINFVIKEKI